MQRWDLFYRIPFFLCGRCGIIKTENFREEESAFLPHIYRVKNSYDRESYEDGTAFLIGNEGKGLTDQAADAADCLIRIPDVRAGGIP